MREAAATEHQSEGPTGGVAPNKRGADERPAEAEQRVGRAAGRVGDARGPVEGGGDGVQRVLQLGARAAPQSLARRRLRQAAILRDEVRH